MRRLLVALAGLAAAWVVMSLVLFLWSPWASEPPRHADVVVVLSGDKKRLGPGLELFREGRAGMLAISSVDRTRRWAAARRLCGRPRVLCFDAVPYSTQGEARTVSRLAREHGWRSIVVVTSRFHVTRTRMLFRRCWKGPLHVLPVGSTWWKLPYAWATETGKLAVQLTVRRAC